MAAPDAVRDPDLRNRPRLNTIEAVKQIIQRYGFRGLYTGFHLHALRDSVGSALYFGVYETVKQITVKKLGPDTSPFGGTMVAGAVCSTVPWFCVSTTCLLGHTIAYNAFLDLSSRYPQNTRAECSAWKDQASRRGLSGRLQIEHVQRHIYHPVPDRH